MATAGSDHDGDVYKDLGWHGTTPDMPDWSATSHALAWLIDGSSAETGGPADAPDLYVASNSYWGNLTFTIPTAPNGKCWWLLADTGRLGRGHGERLLRPVRLRVEFPASAEDGRLPPTASRPARRWCWRPGRATSSEAIRVDFTVNGFTTSPGQDLYVVGSVARARRLGHLQGRQAQLGEHQRQWSGPDFFFASKGASIQYKYIMKQGGTVTWEGGSNRTYTVPTSGAGTRTDTWQP